MPFNGSGTYSLSDTISNGTPNDADELQAILDDIATGLTNAVCVDGQSSMTGVLKLANGSAAAPSATFASDTNTGFYRKAADDLGVSVAGAIVANFDASGLTLASGKALGGSNIVVTANITDAAVTVAKIATQADGTVLANVSGGSASPTAATITSVIDKVYGTQGGILYRGASTWAGLAAGTSGQFLKTQGAGANPVWATITEVPSLSGNTNKVLTTTDGSTATMSFGPAVRASAYVSNATAGTIGTGSFNVTSAVRNSTGLYTVTYATALANAGAPQITPVSTSAFIYITANSTTGFTFQCVNTSAAAIDISGYTFIVGAGV